MLSPEKMKDCWLTKWVLAGRIFELTSPVGGSCGKMQPVYADTNFMEFLSMDVLPATSLKLCILTLCLRVTMQSLLCPMPPLLIGKPFELGGLRQPLGLRVGGRR